MSEAGVSSPGVWRWPGPTAEHVCKTSGQRGGTETGPDPGGEVWRGKGGAGLKARGGLEGGGGSKGHLGSWRRGGASVTLEPLEVVTLRVVGTEGPDTSALSEDCRGQRLLTPS